MLGRTRASFGFAWAGVRHTACTQPNWRIHVVIAVVAVALGLVLRVQPLELAILALAIGFVLALECMNTAVEAAIDSQGGEPSLVGKYAKDSAAGSVLVGAIAAVVVGVIIFAPRLLALL